MNTRQAEQRKHEVKVGLTILIALMIVIFTIMSISQQRGLFRDKYQLIVYLSHVNGLQTGAPVRLAGVRIGTVVNVGFSDQTENKSIRVVLEVDKATQERIRADSEAHIGTLGLLGDKYIGVTMGSLDQPVLKHGEKLKGSDPIDIEKLIDDGMLIFGALKKTVDSINEITKSINNSKGTLGLLVNDPRVYFEIDKLLLLLEEISNQMATGEGTVAKIMMDPSLYNNLNSFAKSAMALSDSLRIGKGTAGQLVRDPKVFLEFSQAVAELNKVMHKMEQGEGTLGQMITNKELYNKLLKVTAEMDSLIQDIEDRPQRYLKLELF
ncbi:MCE family protein [candidate division KSB1 bacterium]|nr:MCE family protein [candidate division KSB1 bacterium]